MSIKTYECVVIGGGAAGMMAAAILARNQIKVLIIEHTKRLGSKILQTGNGKCNFTNAFMSKECYQNENKEFVEKIITSFTNTDTLDFFKSIGVYYKDKNGYIYPHSETAHSLQDALRYELESSDYVSICNECEVGDIYKKKDESFIIMTNQENYRALSVLLATGSKAAPKTGSDGSGYIIAERLGHSIVEPLPALVQLVSCDKNCKSMAGVRSTGRVSLFINNKETVSDIGEIQYTDYGISGIPVFQISRYAVKALYNKCKVNAVIDMLPDIDNKMLHEIVAKNAKKYPDKTIEQLFSGMINKKLIQGICKSLNISCESLVKDNNEGTINNICNRLKEYNFKITDNKSFEQAQICQGGVNLDEISSATMQSKIKSGLFFAGEIVDVDGKCGGYNLQWAWSSAAVAAKGIINYVGRKC